MSDEKQKSGSGCFAKGCFTLVVVAAVLAGLTVWGYYRLTDKALKYTSANAEMIPVEKSSDDQYQILVKRMDSFKRLEPGRDARLILTAHDLNTLIAYSPEWKLAAGKITTRIEHGQIAIVGSIPLSVMPGLRDQYLNGVMYFVPSIESKVLHVKIQDIRLKNAGLSKDSVKAVEGAVESNLTNRLLGDPVIGTVLIKAETLKVDLDTIVLTSAK